MIAFCHSVLMTWYKRVESRSLQQTKRLAKQTSLIRIINVIARDNVPVNSGWMTRQVERGCQSMKLYKLKVHTSVLVEAVVASPSDVVNGVSVHRTVVLVVVVLARHRCYVGARQGIN